MIQITTTFPRALRSRSMRYFATAFFLCGFMALLWGKIATLDAHAIWGAITSIRPVSCGAALIATWFSLRAVGQYDAIWHKILKTEVAPHWAASVGTRAIAIAQTVGFGAISAAVVRRHFLPAMTLPQLSALSVAVPATFMGCWSVYALCAVWWLGTGGGISPFWVALVSLGSMGLLFIVLLRKNRWVNDADAWHLLQLFCLTGIDLFWAAVALYLVMPAGVDIGFSTLIAAYIIALGAGLLTNTPGGVGAFDLTLLGLLSGQEGAVAGLIVFRVIYYAVPAIVALCTVVMQQPRLPLPAGHPAHWGLARQNGQIQTAAGQHCYVARLPFFVCTIGGQTHRFDIARFQTAALWRATCAVLYNCSGPMAAHAALAGWHVRRTTMEALIRPQNWSLNGKHRQSLRRKLKHAELAGVHVCSGTYATHPEIAKIARTWKIAHGGELGFSMGRFCPRYVAKQRLFLIIHQETVQGFVSFHVGQNDWHLDLIRYRPGLPDGAIHAAIVKAIITARCENIGLVSLATVPDPRYTPAFWANRRQGLAQFKRSFGPVWVARYHAAPNKFAFWASGIAIAIAVHRPVANLAWRILQLINLLPLELKFIPKRDKRRVQQIQRSQKS